jgi:hypothetical protein
LVDFDCHKPLNRLNETGLWLHHQGVADRMRYQQNPDAAYELAYNNGGLWCTGFPEFFERD